jgi:hypothetical protein
MLNRAMISVAACTIALLACDGQDTPARAKAPKTDTTAAVADTPHVEVKVNKQYDEHGNLIAYDSSYVSIYHHGLKDPAGLDSLFQGFRSPFVHRYPFLNDPGFDNLFFNDSLLFQDFFRDDFFRKRLELNDHYMRRMMEQMDSLKNQWFQQRAMPPPAPPPARDNTRPRTGTI